MKLSRRTFILTSLAVAVMVMFGGLSTNWLHKLSAAQGYQTTIERTLIPLPVPSTSPKLRATDVSKFAQYGYGFWKEGEGIGYQKRLDLMPIVYADKGVTNTAKLLRFFTISDIHITDKESPAQVNYLGIKYNFSSGYSPVMLYSTHVLDAAIQKINALNKRNTIDFGISLGDVCNNAQYNELRWYIDVIDGKVITPSSGAHAGADTIDYQKPYKAAGLDKTIPWYQVLGNHDQFWMGTSPVNDYVRQAYIGEDILNLGDILKDPQGLDSRGFYMGVLDGKTPYGDVIGAGPVGDYATPPKVVADPNRRYIAKQEWMREFLQTSSRPVGHGFNQSNVDQDFACYSFEPKSDIPIKVIVLDDTQRADDVEGGGYKWHGSVDKKRYDWLVNELDKGQSEGKLMIIASHIPIGVEKPGSFMSWWSHAYVSEKALIAKLHEYPNLVMWIAGHRHFNTVTAFKSPDDTRPELGFWQVETSSLRDFPQQFRMFEIVRNSDNTISIFTANIAPEAEEGTPAAISRSYSIAVLQTIANSNVSSNPGLLLPTGSYNAELVKPLSPEMQAKIRKYGT